MADIVLARATVVTMNKHREILRDGAVAIDGNKIVDVDKTERIKARYKADIELDCTGKLILPGLIDCHAHLAQALIRGCADDIALIPWLCARVWPLQGTYTKKEGELSAQLCCLEMIKSGTTAFVESGLHSRYGFNGIARVVESIGIRAALSKKLMNITGYADIPDAMPESMIETGEETMRETLGMIRKWHGKANNRIHVWFGARTPGACTVDFYREIGARARKSKTGVTVHLAEVKQDVAYLRKEFDMTPMEFMKHCGLVGKHLIYAHGVWLPTEDLPRLHLSGGTVCHCPTSNLKLASGFADVRRMLKAQVNVAVGCDGGPSNNSYDMLREMKFAALIHKGRELDSEIVPAETVLEMATLNGARATLWGEELGSLGPGKLADLIVIDQRKPHLVPVRNPVSNLVYAASRNDVGTVIIDGKIVMKGREVRTIDEAEIVERAQEVGLEVDKRLGLEISSRWPVR